MSNQEGRLIAVSFLRIHDVITRGVSVSMEATQAALQQGFEDEKGREGFFNYLRALSSILHSHHLMEDELAFPYFRELLPQAPFDVLVRWHEEMVEMLDEINRAVAACEQNDQVEVNLRRLSDTLARLDDSWQPHIQMEFDEFIALADDLISEEEQLRLVRQFAEHGQQHSGPPYLTIPFVLYNLPPEERAVLARAMPAEVTQHLVPVVWKEQWASMAPYLLP